MEVRNDILFHHWLLYRNSIYDWKEARMPTRRQSTYCGGFFKQTGQSLTYTHSKSINFKSTILCSHTPYPDSLTQATNTSNVSIIITSSRLIFVIDHLPVSLYRSGSCLQLSRRHYCRMRCGIPVCFERGIHYSHQYFLSSPR